jgi:hypothetical protein
MLITETVYLGHDNTMDLLLKAGGSAQDLSSVTRMTLAVGDDTVNSDEDADAFDWDTGTTGKVIISLGDQDLAEGRHRAELVVYDPDNTNGVVWGRFFLVVT